MYEASWYRWLHKWLHTWLDKWLHFCEKSEKFSDPYSRFAGGIKTKVQIQPKQQMFLALRTTMPHDMTCSASSHANELRICAVSTSGWADGGM